MGAIRLDQPSGREQAIGAFRKQVRNAIEHGGDPWAVICLWALSGDVDEDRLLDAYYEETEGKPGLEGEGAPLPGSVRRAPWA